MGEHEKAGYGARDIGYGSKPAILVVDFQRAFTDPSFELGRFEHVHKAVERTAILLKTARELGIPVAKCYTAYESERDVLNWKVDVLHREFFHGHPCTELDPRIHDPGYDYSFCKMSASIFSIPRLPLI
jgi:maleamate amidohydrolase